MNWKNFETKRYNCMVNVDNGKIIAYEKSARLSRSMIETNVSEFINPFPYTDKDFIIIEAKRVLV